MNPFFIWSIYKNKQKIGWAFTWYKALSKLIWIENLKKVDILLLDNAVFVYVDFDDIKKLRHYRIMKRSIINEKI